MIKEGKLHVPYLRHNKFLVAFGRNLKSIRTKKNISQADLAYGIGMEVSQISRLERGLINTGISNVYLIAKFLGLHPKDLLDF